MILKVKFIYFDHQKMHLSHYQQQYSTLDSFFIKKNITPTVTNTCGEPCGNKWEVALKFLYNFSTTLKL